MLAFTVRTSLFAAARSTTFWTSACFSVCAILDGSFTIGVTQ